MSASASVTEDRGATRDGERVRASRAPESIEVAGRLWMLRGGTGRRPFVAQRGGTQVYGPTLNDVRKYLERIGGAPWH